MKDLKIIVTTSNQYLHILPLFCHLFNKYWSSDQQVEIVGYDIPKYDLPSNFTFYSLGEQSGNKKDFSNDLRKYFEKQPSRFVWMMEDTFLKNKVNFESLEVLKRFTKNKNCGRINLSGETVKQKHSKVCEIGQYSIYENDQDAEYRLSTQPSVWNRDFLLKYLTKGLSPWDFETQYSKNDNYIVVGMNKYDCPIKHNEGVRRFDIFNYDFSGIDGQTLSELQTIIKQNNIQWNR